MLRKIGHKPSGGQIVKSQKISVFIMLFCKQLDSSQQTKLYPDTYSLQILSFNSPFVIIEGKVAHIL